MKGLSIYKKCDKIEISTKGIWGGNMKTGKRKNTAAKWIIGILAAAAAAVLIFILSIFAIDIRNRPDVPLSCSAEVSVVSACQRALSE